MLIIKSNNNVKIDINNYNYLKRGYTNISENLNKVYNCNFKLDLNNKEGKIILSSNFDKSLELS